MSLATATPESNQFRALLGRSFHCPQCHHLHRPHSGPARLCAFLAGNLLQKTYPPPSFNVDCNHYTARVGWYKHNGRTDPNSEIIFRNIFRDLQMLSFNSSPDPTMAELAGSEIDTHYRTRYLLWREEIAIDLALRSERAQTILAELELQFPPPNPVGIPIGQLDSSSILLPSLRATNEILRIQDLLIKHPITVSPIPGPAIVLTLPILGHHLHNCSHIHHTSSKTCGKYFSIVDYLENIFKTPYLFRIFPRPLDVKISSCFLPDSFALDPLFWASVTLERNRYLTLTTHPFQLEP